MEKNPIDDLFQNRLRDREAAPPAFVWAAVEKAIAAKKRRRAAAFWTLGLLGLLGGGAAFFALKNEKAATENAVSSPVAAAEKAQNPTTFFDPKTAENEVEKSSEKAISKPVFETKNGSDAAAFSTKNDAPFLANLSKKERDILTEKGATTNTVFDLFENQKNNKRTAIEQKNDFLNQAQNEETAAENAFEKASFIKKEKLLFEPLLAKNRLAGFEKTTAREPPIIKNYRAKKRAKSCPTFGASGNAFLLEGWVGPTFVLKELRPQLIDAPNYANRRAATENAEFSWNAGLRGAFLFHRKFMVRGGFQYTAINEAFNLRSKYAITIFPDPTQTDTIVRYGELVKKTFNRLGFLDVPLTVGAELVGGQFGLSLHGGAAMNLVFWKRGEVLMADGDIQKFRNSKILKANAGLSLLGSAQVFYQINSKTRLFAEPYFQKILRPVTVSSYEIEQRYATSGVQIGLTRLLK